MDHRLRAVRLPAVLRRRGVLAGLAALVLLVTVGAVGFAVNRADSGRPGARTTGPGTAADLQAAVLPPPDAGIGSASASASPAPSPSAPASPSRSSSRPAGPSGQAMPVGNLPGWRQIFTEDFSTDVKPGSFPGSVYGPKWSVYANGIRDTSKRGLYAPSKILSVQNGMLTKFLHTEGGSPLVASALPKAANQTYGRYTVRFRADSVVGYKTAWLLWPDSEQWPRDGEIDFPEGSLNSNINAFMHFANPNGGQNAFETSIGYQSWHTATIEWLPGKVTFILDDKVIGVATKQVPATPMHYVLQTETNIGGAAPPASAAGNVQVDWITIYARA